MSLLVNQMSVLIRQFVQLAKHVLFLGHQLEIGLLQIVYLHQIASIGVNMGSFNRSSGSGGLVTYVFFITFDQLFIDQTALDSARSFVVRDKLVVCRIALVLVQVVQLACSSFGADYGPARV